MGMETISVEDPTTRTEDFVTKNPFDVPTVVKGDFMMENPFDRRPATKSDFVLENPFDAMLDGRSNFTVENPFDVKLSSAHNQLDAKAPVKAVEISPAEKGSKKTSHMLQVKTQRNLQQEKWSFRQLSLAKQETCHP